MKVMEIHNGNGIVTYPSSNIREDKEMQKMSRLAQSSGDVSTKEGLWTWTTHVEFIEVWSSPSELFIGWAGLHKSRADNLWT
ncbi:hypothetical protein YC2023_076385 [Brassica napus]